MDICEYWQALGGQQAEKMRAFFHPDALIRWHNTNEQFSVDEFIKANCVYPGTWEVKIQRIETTGSLTVTVVQVCAEEHTFAHYAVSFIRIDNDKIISIDEYWGENGDPPAWRRDMKLGSPFR